MNSLPNIFNIVNPRDPFPGTPPVAAWWKYGTTYSFPSLQKQNINERIVYEYKYRELLLASYTSLIGDGGYYLTLTQESGIDKCFYEHPRRENYLKILEDGDVKGELNINTHRPEIYVAWLQTSSSVPFVLEVQGGVYIPFEYEE
jgi:hypothetical protein